MQDDTDEWLKALTQGKTMQGSEKLHDAALLGQVLREKIQQDLAAINTDGDLARLRAAMSKLAREGKPGWKDKLSAWLPAWNWSVAMGAMASIALVSLLAVKVAMQQPDDAPGAMRGGETRVVVSANPSGAADALRQLLQRHNIACKQDSKDGGIELQCQLPSPLPDEVAVALDELKIQPVPGSQINVLFKQ